jgi:hypothetical protein
VQLSARDEVRQLVRGEVARLRLVRAERVLVFELPEGAYPLLRRNCVDLAGVRAAIEDEDAPTRLVELAVSDEVARDELSEPVEQLARERIGAGRALGLTQETERPLEIGVSQYPQETKDTTIVV